jgi:hypothetical protein
MPLSTIFQLYLGGLMIDMLLKQNHK